MAWGRKRSLPKGVAAQAALTKLTESIVDESEEPYDHRIYYYDMALDDEGQAYVLYARPKPDRVHTDVILAVETPHGWVKAIATPASLYRPDAIHIDRDAAGNFHLIYPETTGTLDIFGNPESDLVYVELSRAEIHGWIGNQEVFFSQISAREQKVSMGGWRSQLEVAADNTPYILREFETGFCLYTPDASVTEKVNTECSVIYPGWRVRKLALPPINWSRLGEFYLDPQGGAHLLYGDYAYNAQGQPYASGGNFGVVDHFGFHNLWYASAPAPEAAWGAQLITENPNGPPTLYNWQFWVDLTTDEAGRPAITKWLWKPGTPDVLAYDTKSVFFYHNGSGWQGAFSTPTFADVAYYANGPVAGMGPGVVKTAEGWHGVWDSSHSRPYDHISPRGGLMYRFSPDGMDWRVHQLLAEYSAEGRVEMQRHGNTLNLLVLGDHTDAKLYFMRWQLPAPAHLEVFPDRRYYYRGEAVKLAAQIGAGTAGDLYAALISHARPEIRQPAEIWQLTPELTWKPARDLSELEPFMNIAAQDMQQRILTLPAIPSLSAPFAKKDTYYDIYSVVAQPGTHVLDMAWLTPLTMRPIFANIAIPRQ